MGILFAAKTLISKIFSQKELVIARLWEEELLSKLEELSTRKIVL